LVATNMPTKYFAVSGLAFATTYYWRIVARDVQGAEASGPTWSFTTRPSNLPPAAPSSPLPAHAAVNQPIDQSLHWLCSDPEGDAITFDVYFGASAPPPLVMSNSPGLSFAPGPLAFSTLYYWRIVARDAFGAETSGPTWSFSTVAYSAPTTPSNPHPADGGIVVTHTPTLSWTTTDADGQSLTHDVYFGTSPTPPLAASGLTTPAYAPGMVSEGITYYWRVVVTDGTTPVSGPTWSFTFSLPSRGDVTGDGQVTVDDAGCAFQVYLGMGSATCAVGGAGLADVDCNGGVTPADARCIHKAVVDGSCSFCGDAAAAAASGSAVPYLYVVNWYFDGSFFLNVTVGVNDVAALNAFGFVVHNQPNTFFLGATRTGATYDYDVLGSQGYSSTGVVGGYDLDGVNIGFGTAFIDLQFIVLAQPWAPITLDTYVDDLAGAAPLVIDGSSPPVPVLFTRFDAAPTDGGIEVRWELSSDEAVESFTLYRREGAAPLPISIADGSGEDLTGSYLDREVEPGQTYRYEMLVRAADGDEFRSPVVTATARALALALHQNHPNPFNPRTTIRYDIPGDARGSRVRLAVYDLQGGLVRTLVDDSQGSGGYSVDWDGSDDRGRRVASGVYFYVLEAAGERLTRKLVLLK
jgi:hypothetical protein